MTVIVGSSTTYRSCRLTNEYGDLLVLDGATPDPNGVTWLVSALEGWAGGPVRQTKFPWPNAHGTYEDNWYADERTITVSGVCWAPSEAACTFAEDSIASATNALVNQGTLRVIDGGTFDRSINFRRSGEIKWTQDIVYAAWSVPIVCQDPFRYNTVVNTGTLNGGGALNVNPGGTQPSTIWNYVGSVISAGGSTTAELINNSLGVHLLIQGFPFNDGDQLVIASNYPRVAAVLRTGVGIFNLRPYITGDSQWFPLQQAGGNLIGMNFSSGTMNGTFEWLTAWA